jgi:hypothetical protein
MKTGRLGRIGALLSALFIGAALSGCAGTAPGLAPDHLSLIRAGFTNVADLAMFFGRPSARTRRADGAETLEWRLAGNSAAGACGDGVVPTGSGRLTWLQVDVDATGTVRSFLGCAAPERS